ncbi:hypothetical protein F444_08608 [Phytophthora nicotianae P1976]|uniref:Uncharacterized protein n=1 Tax=Phytophthora nicotianae P1976 TaxID=1317066 RepID=A0A081AAD0_PHYNI|nr:hypothetical protein F444_08608 [Phytophthora nicotianae P1976]
MKASAVFMMTLVNDILSHNSTLAEFLYALACASIFTFVWWFHWLRHDAAVLDEHIAADPGPTWNESTQA